MKLARSRRPRTCGAASSASCTRRNAACRRVRPLVYAVARGDRTMSGRMHASLLCTLGLAVVAPQRPAGHFAPSARTRSLDPTPWSC
jgi:hypothetical protein